MTKNDVESVNQSYSYFILAKFAGLGIFVLGLLIFIQLAPRTIFPLSILISMTFVATSLKQLGKSGKSELSWLPLSIIAWGFLDLVMGMFYFIASGITQDFLAQISFRAPCWIVFGLWLAYVSHKIVKQKSSNKPFSFRCSIENAKIVFNLSTLLLVLLLLVPTPPLLTIDLPPNQTLTVWPFSAEFMTFDLSGAGNGVLGIFSLIQSSLDKACSPVFSFPLFGLWWFPALILIIPISFSLVKKDNWKALRFLTAVGLLCYISIPIQFSMQYRLNVFGSKSILSFGYFLLLIPILMQTWSVFPTRESYIKSHNGKNNDTNRINNFAFPLAQTLLAVFIAISWTLAQPSIMKPPIQRLIEAAESGNTKDLPYYLEKVKGRTKKYGVEMALCEAIDKNCVSLFDWLLTQKPDLNVIPEERGDMPLWHSIRANGNLEITEKLLKSGANPNILLSKGSFSDTALGLALSMSRHRPLKKNMDFFKILIDNGADLNSPVNAKGEFPAEVILGNDDAEIILTEFIKHGMNPLKTSGENLFFKASLARKPEQLKILQAAGLTSDAVDRNGNSFLHLAIFRNYGGDLRLSDIQKKYAEDVVNNQNLEGKTPLHLAVERNEPQIVKLLLKYGANPEIKDKKGLTPEQLAEKERYLRVLKIIRSSN